VTRIAVDMDGVLYEFERTMRYLLREERGYHNLTKPSEFWDDIVGGIDPIDAKWLWTEGVRLGLFRHGHVVKHAIRAIRALAAQGHQLRIVTHRPAQAAKDTIAWVDFHFGGEDPYPFWGAPLMLHGGESKTIVDAELLIDDKPENVEEWVATGREALLFDQPWNQDCKAGTRVKGWYDVMRHLGVSKETPEEELSREWMEVIG
jgi:5'(3')-deoxyribonucleotidase